MAPRSVPRRQRDNVDYSAIGKLGRRTGVTLDQRPLDANGMEEISGIFSSPRKPSPLKKMTTMESVEEGSASPESVEDHVNPNPSRTPSRTPASRGSTRRRSMLPPRSTSPKKSGISGTARKSEGVDIFASRKSLRHDDVEDRENTPVSTPSRNDRSRRFSSSPEKTPLRDIATNGVYSGAKSRPSLVDIEQSDVGGHGPAEVHEPDFNGEALQQPQAAISEVDDFVPPPEEDDESEHADSQREESVELGAASLVDDEEADGTFEPEASEPPPAQNQANSRKKRKSDAIDEEAQRSPVPTKVRKRGRPPLSEKLQTREESSSNVAPSGSKGKRPLRAKSRNTGISSRQQQELDVVIEKVKARPDPPRSLYILRRETPLDETVTHTRSGRVSIKPLAYWRNERCVYGGSPGGASLDEGARFPLNSIKEIVRAEEAETVTEKRKPMKRKKSGKSATVRRARIEDSEASSSDIEIDGAGAEDAYAEAWETEVGTLRGNVSVWDQEEQAPLEQEKEVDIAHAPAAIQTREVKSSSLHEGPTFRYAKLLSTRFFGTGLVELPPGGVKRPKNSRTMHMGFFVVKGRVTVMVGPIGGEVTGGMTRFSIGKGGFWQVPRGNQYSIENELDKTARIFFSQASETSPHDDES
ncbi:hypothetical protein A1O1_01684 [Capronia coronata CBS 617.96]|uniref:CENP-C homolog n=1 Tax=Capronia coronata CBS 617.96 TaxID=1182541 RepID=W9YK67_9EURO|nr:uncharacterized protein A1O1_01684 [Capronia coronata CBS 617.96]EXJ93292.1 hypothetical protein A1O1_01684 [Capronia coronata CBS 617.96]